MLFRESPIFTRQILALVDDGGYLIPGSGGLRKIRMRLAGRGKRGGARIIYYWMKEHSRIYMLLAYAKNARADLSREEIAVLRELVQEDFD
jgi:hypothetical protein